MVTDVPVTGLPALKVGQRASVQPDGLNRLLAGSVVMIGLIPDTSASPVTYPVTIGITGQSAAALHASSFAHVTITAGLKAGQHVVLADLRKPLPSNNLPAWAAQASVRSTSLGHPEPR